MSWLCQDVAERTNLNESTSSRRSSDLSRARVLGYSNRRISSSLHNNNSNLGQSSARPSLCDVTQPPSPAPTLLVSPERNADTQWASRLVTQVRQYVKMHDVPLLTPNERQDVIDTCTDFLLADTWLLRRCTATYLTTEAFAVVYHECATRLVHDYVRFMGVVDPLNNASVKSC